MHIQFKLVLAFLAAVTLIFGATGCRSNGTGAWYSPKSYSLYNPFKKAEADPYSSDRTSQAGTNSKPSLDAQPNVSVPPGGYANPGKDSDFFANGNQKGQKAVQTQYGHGPGSEPVMTATNPYSVPETASTGYSTPVAGTEPYNPYAAATYGANEPVTPSNFQQTRYYEPQNNAAPAAQPVMQQYPQTNSVLPNAADASAVYGNQAPASAIPSNMPAGQPPIPYSPAYPAAPAPYSNAPATYGIPAATPAETAPQGIGAAPAPAGYTANPSSYQPVGGGF
ncbi:hypothetical protein FACS1894214_0850 [Planctomycetales bacterium]|nr:hypothetical protein FACS1894214_0850 [Planctomycetales bacterium]